MRDLAGSQVVLALELHYVGPYASDEERTAALVDFLNTYNHAWQGQTSPHQAARGR